MLEMYKVIEPPSEFSGWCYQTHHGFRRSLRKLLLSYLWEKDILLVQFRQSSTKYNLRKNLVVYKEQLRIKFYKIL